MIFRLSSPPNGQLLSKFHSLTHPVTTEASAGGSWNIISIRTNVRNHFPKPREVKRVKHMYHEHIKTRGGRLILMRRILRGKHVLSH